MLGHLDGQWQNLRSYGQENATDFFVSWGYTDGKEVAHMVVYADLAIILNFAVDLCLLLGTNRLSGYGTSWKRVLPAAVLGSVYGAACLLPGMQFMGNMLWRVVILILMSLIAFGATVSGLRRGILFVFLSMALGGIALGIGKSGFWGIVAFVGIPLPGTGAWTGALIAAMLDMDKKKSFLACIVGVFIAGIIMSIISYGILGNIF